MRLSPLPRLKDRKRERGGLARSGPGTAEDVATFEHVANRLSPDRSGTIVPLLLNGAQDAFDERKIFETTHVGLPLLMGQGKHSSRFVQISRTCGVSGNRSTLLERVRAYPNRPGCAIVGMRMFGIFSARQGRFLRLSNPRPPEVRVLTHGPELLGRRLIVGFPVPASRDALDREPDLLRGSAADRKGGDIAPIGL